MEKVEEKDAVAEVPTGPRVSRREMWVDLPSEYEGFRFRLWLNAPNKLWVAINGGAGEEQIEALQKVILEHNGWLDFDGKPYPPASEAAFWEEIPSELAACILIECQVQTGKLADSQIPKKRR